MLQVLLGPKSTLLTRGRWYFTASASQARRTGEPSKVDGVIGERCCNTSAAPSTASMSTKLKVPHIPSIGRKPSRHGALGRIPREAILCEPMDQDYGRARCALGTRGTFRPQWLFSWEFYALNAESCAFSTFHLECFKVIFINKSHSISCYNG